MGIKEKELNEDEIRTYFQKLLRNKISISDLSKTQILQIYFYAEDELNMAISNINGYLIANPGTTFEYWTKVNKNYQDAMLIIDLLKPIANGIILENLQNLDQYLKIQEEYVNKYNWTLGEVPENFNSITGIDFFMLNLRKVAAKFEGESGGAKLYETVLSVYINAVEKHISNPLHISNVDVYKYFLQSLNSEKKTLELLETKMNEVSEKEIDQKTPTFINNFDRVEPYVVYNYFKKELVDKKFLTEQELNEYLKYAFEIKEVPKIRFRIKNARTKSVIVAVFYYYFKNVAGVTHGTQRKYAALLGDYFEGYKTSTVSSNFSK
ncbi:MAG TPA: hypothetical protein PLQ57_13025 [Saprospiraceae bacterium]|nr:hypothetical protein [Saprospiraceae bacterium]